MDQQLKERILMLEVNWWFQARVAITCRTVIRTTSQPQCQPGSVFGPPFLPRKKDRFIRSLRCDSEKFYLLLNNLRIRHWESGPHHCCRSCIGHKTDADCKLIRNSELSTGLWSPRLEGSWQLFLQFKKVVNVHDRQWVHRPSNRLFQFLCSVQLLFPHITSTVSLFHVRTRENECSCSLKD